MFNEDLAKTAAALVAACKEGRELEALNTIYSPDVVSIEAVTMPGGMDRTFTGLDALRGKHEWWYGAHEVHSTSADGPFLHDPDKFSVIFSMDVTTKETGVREQMTEVALYTVDGGKIVREEFFYPTEG